MKLFPHRFAIAPALLALSISCATFNQVLASQMLHGHVPAAATHLRPIGQLPGETELNLTIALPLRQEPELQDLLRQVYDPASSRYHQYLTPQEFTSEFGPDAASYEAVINFAQTHGLTITRKHPNRMLLSVRASVAEIRSAFGVKLQVYEHPIEPRTFFAPDKDPEIDLNAPVLAIRGLDDYILPKPAGTASALGGSGPGGAYIGTNFRAAYVPGVSLTGSNQSVALVEFDGYHPQDIATYDAAAGISGVTLSNIFVDGFNGQPSYNNSEVAGDIELVSSMAPQLAKIFVYEENIFSPAEDMLNRLASDDTASQISCSWSFTIASNAVLDQILQEFAIQGQSFFCASGDDGAYPLTDIPTPDGNPWTTMVGGTILTTSNTGGGWKSETAWSGSGGGPNTNFPIPFWQSSVSMTANGGSTNYRNFPDVAACATGIQIVADEGQWEEFIGTSAAAPIWAGFTALVNQQGAQYGESPVGFLNPALYRIGLSTGYTTNFHDVTSGNTTNSNDPHGYFAVPGYDLCTGWGTPNGSNLINTLAPPDTLVVLPITFFDASGPAGGSFSLTHQTFLLSNNSSISLSWCLQTNASWIEASPQSGTLTSFGTASVSASLVPSAYLLPPAQYVAQLFITNLNNGLVHLRSFELNISDPLLISSAAPLTFAFSPGCPINFSPQWCEISNSSQASVSWSVSSAPSWLDVMPASGNLATNTATSVQCAINTSATNWTVGQYSSFLIFSNNTFSAIETVPVTLVVGQLVENGGFEAGNFTHWNLSGDTNYIFVDNLTYDPESPAVHSGTYGADLSTYAGIGFLSQIIPTVPGQSYQLSLWLNCSRAGGTNGFEAFWNGATLFSETNPPDVGWTNIQCVVAASAPETTLTIGFDDTNGVFGLDDISVTQIPPAAPQAALQGPASIVLTWPTTAGMNYAVQTNCDLTSTNWATLGNWFAGSGSALSLTDSLSGSQRYYRIVQAPP